MNIGGMKRCVFWVFIVYRNYLLIFLLCIFIMIGCASFFSFYLGSIFKLKLWTILSLCDTKEFNVIPVEISCVFIKVGLQIFRCLTQPAFVWIQKKCAKELVETQNSSYKTVHSHLQQLPYMRKALWTFVMAFHHFGQISNQ